MNLRELEYIVAVAKTENFSQAAEECHVSQPALSSQVRKLEAELGVQIFERGRSIRPTPVGATIIEIAQEIIERASKIEDTAKLAADPLSGTLALGAIPTIAPYLAPTLMAAMRHNLPFIDLDLVEDLTGALEEMLANGAIDAAITATTPNDPQIAEILLYDEPFWVALPNSHLLTEREEIELEELEADEMLLLEDGHCLRDQVLGYIAPVGEKRSSFKTQRTSLSTILALVGSGAGVTIVPAMSLSGPWMTDSGVVARRERHGTAYRTIRLIYRKSYTQISLLERLADMLCAVVPDTVRPVKR